MSDLYSELILDHASTPQNVGGVLAPTHQGSALNMSCGDSVALTAHVDEAGIVTEIGWTGDGCAISRASLSILTEWAKGRKLEEVQSLSPEKVLEMLGGTISPGRIKCVLLSLNAFQHLQII